MKPRRAPGGSADPKLTEEEKDDDEK